jgi:hypothetical protein
VEHACCIAQMRHELHSVLACMFVGRGFSLRLSLRHDTRAPRHAEVANVARACVYFLPP